ncbi:hypothetical protein K1719_024049 [Acacia pycnantha]|nr:hypothetical protein K1719_042558 [Acacia pycnantha]KAI9075472.1 hypothetical protein K1719_042560 [Acacia pycnantha]KAI9100925.1 hypothetical protein K1719_024049 [Acacia pycnantha]
MPSTNHLSELPKNPTCFNSLLHSNLQNCHHRVTHYERGMACQTGGLSVSLTGGLVRYFLYHQSSFIVYTLQLV